MDQDTSGSVGTFSVSARGEKRKRDSDKDDYLNQNGNTPGYAWCNSSVLSNYTPSNTTTSINNNNGHQTPATLDASAVSKRQAGEGVSWWTCLQYDMPMSKTKPQVVERNECHSTNRFCMETLPEKPEKPLDSDCCGSSCIPCVLDIYAEELAIWERECARIKSGQPMIPSENAAGTEVDYVSPELSISEYHQYQISSITQETWDTWRFTCQLGHNQCLGLLPGQHVVIRGCIEGKSITRQYTPVSDVTLKGSFQLIIKVYEFGRMSQLVKQWQVGDWLNIRGPCGNLQYIPNAYSRVLMLAAGTGIAPMAQLIQAILSSEREEGRIRLLFACKTYKDILMKHEIEEWQRFWNFSSVYVLSQESSSTSTSTSCYQYGEEIIHGRIDKALLTTELGDNYHGTRVLICGTRSFDTDMLQFLDECHFPREHVFKF